MSLWRISALAMVAFAAPFPARAAREPARAIARESRTSMNAAADLYVSLVLRVGVHDPDYVDAYYGPPEARAAAERQKTSLADIRAGAPALLHDLQTRPEPADELERLRLQYLTRQVQALISRVDMLMGAKMTFDEESQALYDARAPRLGEDHFRPILAELESCSPAPDLSSTASRPSVPGSSSRRTSWTPSSPRPSTSAGGARSPTSACPPARPSPSST